MEIMKGEDRTCLEISGDSKMQVKNFGLPILGVAALPVETTKKINKAVSSERNLPSASSASVRSKRRLKRMARRNRKNPMRLRLVAAIKRKLLRSYSACQSGHWAEFKDDMLIMSLSIFDFLTPSQRINPILVVTPVVTMIAMVVYSFMAGAYSLYIGENHKDSRNSTDWELPELFKMAGYSGVRFDLDYLLKWGGCYLPLINKGETYRWFSSLLVHQSLAHLTTNCLMFVILSSYLEYCYGAIRLASVIFFAGLGGNLLGGLFGNQCSIVVGGSGAIFGLIGFAAADHISSHHGKTTKIRMFLLALIVTLFFFLTIVLEEYNSHINHFGGFLGGAVPSILFMKNLKHELVEVGALWAGLAFLVFFFSLVPTVLLRYVSIDAACSNPTA